MTIQCTAIAPDAARDARARDLVSHVGTWHPTTLRQAWGAFPAGTRCLLTPHGWYVNEQACTCPDYQQNGRICKHVRAVRMQSAVEVVTIDVRDDLVSLTRAGLAALSVPRVEYGGLYPPTCRARGCTDDQADGEGFCTRHRLDDAF